jgi:predicted nuclease of predicted toxin-antitoxin system
VRLLADIFPGSVHVRNVGLRDAEDAEIWEYAKLNGLVIVSKDSDFHERSFYFGFPPKVIWLRIGNCPTSKVEQLLRQNIEVIKEFNEDVIASFLSLS